MSDEILSRADAAAEAVITGLPGGGGELRPLSAGSLALLERAHNPLAERLLAGETQMAAALDSVIEFVWIHAADEGEVVRAVLEGKSQERALLWGLGLPVEQLAAYTQQVLHAQEVLRGVASAVEPDAPSGGKGGAPRKNAPSPHSVQRS